MPPPEYQAISIYFFPTNNPDEIGRFGMLPDSAFVTFNIGNCYVRQTNRYNTPAVTFRVSYRFNSAKNKYKGTGAGADAKSRM